MKKTFVMIVYLSLYLLVLPFSAFAGDQAYFKLVGFSQSGEFVAWDTGGIQDGSGFQWTNVEIIDTQTSLQKDFFEHTWDSCVDELPDFTALSFIDDKKNSFYSVWGIDCNQVYEPLVFYPLTDLGVERDTVVFCLESFLPDYNSGEIRLILTNKPANIPQEYPDWFDAPVTPVLTMSLGQGEFVFFEENIVPECWRFSMSYSIYAVYKNPFLEDNLVVVLNTIKPGFEGVNGRFRVVSGFMHQD